MINELVAAYLRENKRLVIPGLGAFIRKDGSGEVVFVEFLKKDDGVLAGLLEVQYGLSRTEALEAIAQYAELVKQHIARSGRFVVGGVGVLHSDANSLLELDYDPAAEERASETPIPGAKSLEGESRGSVPESGTVRPAVAKPEASKPETPKPVVPKPEAPKPTPVRTPEQPVKIRPTLGTEEKKPEPGGRNAEGQRPSIVSVPTGAPKPTERPMGGSKPGRTAAAPGRPAVPRNKKKRADLIMIIAIVAALMAIGAMVYSMLSQVNPEVKLLEVTPAVQDTVSVEK